MRVAFPVKRKPIHVDLEFMYILFIESDNALFQDDLVLVNT